MSFKVGTTEVLRYIVKNGTTETDLDEYIIKDGSNTKTVFKRYSLTVNENNGVSSYIRKIVDGKSINNMLTGSALTDDTSPKNTLYSSFNDPTKSNGEYTVTYDLNGGSGTIANDKGSTSYTFTKWTDGSGKDFNKDTLISSDTSITANYSMAYLPMTLTSSTPTAPSRDDTYENQYVINFDNSNGTGDASKTSITASSNYISHPGSFSKWKDSANNTYSSSESFTGSAATNKLTAQYTYSDIPHTFGITAPTASKSDDVNTVTGSVLANGGTTPATTSYSSTRTVTYTLDGWYTAKSNGTREAEGGKSFTPTSSKTLYSQYSSSKSISPAKWTLPAGTTRSDEDDIDPNNPNTNKYTVSYDLNGGSKTSVYNDVSLYKQKHFTFKSYLCNRDSSEYSASSQYTVPDVASDISISFSAQWTETAAYKTVTLAAKPANWDSDSTQYTISYNNGGGSSTPSSQTVKDYITHAFSNWTSSDSNYSTATYAAGATSHEIKGNTKFTANWSGITHHRSVKLANAISKANTKYGDIVVTYNTDSKYTVPNTNGTNILNLMSTKSHTFSHWQSSDSSYNTINYAAGSNSHEISANTTFTAQFTESNTVNYPTIVLASPTNDNYKFTAWWNSGTGTTKIGNAGANYTPTSSVTLYSQWIKNPSLENLNDASKNLSADGNVSTIAIRGEYTNSKDTTYYYDINDNSSAPSSYANSFVCSTATALKSSISASHGSYVHAKGTRDGVSTINKSGAIYTYPYPPEIKKEYISGVLNLCIYNTATPNTDSTYSKCKYLHTGSATTSNGTQVANPSIVKNIKLDSISALGFMNIDASGNLSGENSQNALLAWYNRSRNGISTNSSIIDYSSSSITRIGDLTTAIGGSDWIIGW